MKEIRTEFLFGSSIQVPADQTQDIGVAAAGRRIIVKATGGEYSVHQVF